MMDDDEPEEEPNFVASSSSTTTTTTTPSSTTNHQRVIICLDLDCFFVQVEQHRQPALLRHCSLLAVQQHDDLIAVSYEARKRGVQKHDSPQVALEKCPELKLVHVPMFPGTSKVTYQHYRSHSQRIFQFVAHFLKTHPVLKQCIALNNNNKSSPSCNNVLVMEKASIDEVYIDVTRVCHHLSSMVDQIDGIDEMCDRLNRETVPLPGEKRIDYCELKRAIVERNKKQKSSRSMNDDSSILSNRSDSESESDDDGVDLLLACLGSEDKPIVGNDGSSAEMHHHIRDKATKDNELYDISKLSNDDVALFMGHVVTLMVRDAIKKKLNFEASAGVASNKLLAKLASSVHKPNNQTIIFLHQLDAILETTHIAKIPRLAWHLGSQENMHQFLGKLGQETKSMADLQRLPLNELDDLVGEKASNFLFNCARGIDRELVVQKGPPKQVSVSMSLKPISNEHMGAIHKIIGFLALELVERLKEDRSEFNRSPCSIHCRYRLVDCREMSTNSLILTPAICSDKDRIQQMIFESFEKSVSKNYVHVSQWGLRWISVICASFTPVIREKDTVLKFFQKGKDGGSSSTPSTMVHSTPHIATTADAVEEESRSSGSSRGYSRSNGGGSTIPDQFKSTNMIEPMQHKNNKSTTNIGPASSSPFSFTSSTTSSIPSSSSSSSSASSAATSASSSSAQRISSLFEPDKNSTTCPVCNRSIPISLATIHVNNHFRESSSSPSSVSASSTVSSSSSSTSRDQTAGGKKTTTHTNSHSTSTKKTSNTPTSKGKGKKRAAPTPPPSNTLDNYFAKKRKS